MSKEAEDFILDMGIEMPLVCNNAVYRKDIAKVMEAYHQAKSKKT